MKLPRNIHLEAAQRIELWRLNEFDVERLESHEKVFVFKGKQRVIPKTSACSCLQRFGIFQNWFRQNLWLPMSISWILSKPILKGFVSFRRSNPNEISARDSTGTEWPFTSDLSLRGESEMLRIARRLEAPHEGLAFKKWWCVHGSPMNKGNRKRPKLCSEIRAEIGWRLNSGEPNRQPIRSQTPYQLAVIRARRLGLIYPYEIIRMLEGKETISGDTFDDLDRGFRGIRSGPHLSRPIGLREGAIGWRKQGGCCGRSDYAFYPEVSGGDDARLDCLGFHQGHGSLGRRRMSTGHRGSGSCRVTGLPVE